MSTEANGTTRYTREQVERVIRISLLCVDFFENWIDIQYNASIHQTEPEDLFHEAFEDSAEFAPGEAWRRRSCNGMLIYGNLLV